ncbi:MAG: divergent polysaccharide deacetylase family protein, partial [Candidatus Eremiobacteraeota bacterium]|nr:divergent polysaccharide deacetylase family protein [Candidatus Eremiobacteraeota bacterium]
FTQEVDIKPSLSPTPKPKIITSPVAVKIPIPTKYKGPPKIAIIIDDFGNGLENEKKILELPYKLNISVIPELPKSTSIAEIAYKNDKTVLIHLPMESISKHEETPFRIMSSMSSAEIKSIIERSVESVPHAQGVNNHEGSLATSDEELMYKVFKEIKEKGFFFVDSATTIRTRCKNAAIHAGIPYARRKVFLDNKDDPEYVKGQLKKAKEIARKVGMVVVIGHPRNSTITALKEELPEIEKEGFELVSVKELVRVPPKDEMEPPLMVKDNKIERVQKPMLSPVHTRKTEIKQVRENPGDKGTNVLEIIETEEYIEGDG